MPVADGDWREKYAKGNWLACVGLSKEGRVGSIPVNNNETYKVSFTEDLLKEINNFPPLAGLRNKSDTGLYLDNIVADKLLKIKESSQAAGAGAYGKGTPGLNTFYGETLKRLFSGKPAPRWRWRLNIRDIALQFSETQVSNTERYGQVPNSKLQASDQIFMQGSAKLALESRRGTLWNDTKLSVDYGRIIIKPAGRGEIKSETADLLLLENEISYAVFKLKKLGGAVAGPLVSLGYNTELTHDAGIPKRKIAVGKAGLKVFEGRVIQDFYTAAVMERDFTYSDTYTKLAWETGSHLGGLLGGGGPEYSVDISYKQFSPSRLRATDLKREFELDAKLRIRIFSDLSLAPFAGFYLAKGVTTNEVAHNYIFGISLSYARLFKLRN